MDGRKIRILIAEDHALVRRGLIALLHGHNGIEVIGEAEDGHVAIQRAAELRPDVILMDLEMPRNNGVTATRAIKQRDPDCKVLIITSYGDDDSVISAVRAGANGYLLKTMMPDALLSAIEEVYLGGAPLDPAVTAAILRTLSNPSPKSEVLQPQLTEREQSVLRLVAKGYTDRKIAHILDLSTRTVSTHVRTILGKLEVENRTQAALFALSNGYAELDVDD
ncbi:MAG: response regulator [Candidatus Promineifilaceae bacterium]